MITRGARHPQIQVFTNAVVTDFSGYVGNFKTSLMVGAKMLPRELEHGVTIVATGGEELKPKEYLYGEDSRILTQLELERLMATDGKKAGDLKEVVMSLSSSNWVKIL